MTMADEMAHPIKRELPASAIDHLLDQLWTARGLERYLREALLRSQWQTWTYAMSEVPPSRLEEYSQGGSRFPEVESNVVAAVDACVRAVGGTWIVPDPLARPGDAFLTRSSVPHVVVDDAVYYMDGLRTSDGFGAAWRWARSDPATVGIVTKAALSPQSVSRAALDAAARAVCFVVLRAYDGEGVIMFERHASP